MLSNVPHLAGLILTGEVGADRYGTLYEGSAMTVQIPVRVNVFDPQVLKEASADVLGAAFSRLKRAASAWVVPVVAFDFSGPQPYVAVETDGSPTLMNELRNRGAYPVAEAAALLFDFYASHAVAWKLAGVSGGVVSLAQAQLRDGSIQPGAVAVDPVAVVLKGLLSPARAGAGEMLAYVFCQLLGHHFQEIRGRFRFAPIPVLGAETNEFLRRLFQAGPDETVPGVADVIERLTGRRADEVPMPAIPGEGGPLKQLDTPWTGGNNRLTLLSPGGNRYLRIITAPEAVLGRSSQEADMVTQFYPRSQMNDSRTLRISRKHVVIRRRGGELVVTEPEAQNHSRVDSHAVAAEGVTLAEKSVIVVASEFRSSARRFTGGEAFAIAGEGDFPAGDGALFIEPLEKECLPFSLLWLLSDAAFRKGKGGSLEWCAADAWDATGRFLSVDGQIWLAAAQDQAITIGGVAVPSGHAVPLPVEGILRINGEDWKLVKA